VTAKEHVFACCIVTGQPLQTSRHALSCLYKELAAASGACCQPTGKADAEVIINIRALRLQRDKARF
jgi:hypothetical protein